MRDLEGALSTGLEVYNISEVDNMYIYIYMCVYIYMYMHIDIFMSYTPTHT